MLICVAAQQYLPVTVQLRQPGHSPSFTKPQQSVMFDVRFIHMLPVSAELIPVRVGEATALIPLRTEASVLLACYLCTIPTGQ